MTTSLSTTKELLALLADLVSFRVQNDAGECSWCETDSPVRTTDHQPSCPWRRAQEIVHASHAKENNEMSESIHIIDGDIECSCQPLRLTIAADGSISRIAGGPLEEPIDTAAPPSKKVTP